MCSLSVVVLSYCKYVWKGLVRDEDPQVFIIPVCVLTADTEPENMYYDN